MDDTFVDDHVTDKYRDRRPEAQSPLSSCPGCGGSIGQTAAPVCKTCFYDHLQFSETERAMYLNPHGHVDEASLGHYERLLDQLNAYLDDDDSYDQQTLN
jgi:predicted amidophosphoribosyltransferase